MPSFSKRSRERLATCDERLVIVLEAAIKHVDFTILCGFRDKQAQDDAFSNGRSTKQFPDSMHNRHPSPAVDIMPYPPGPLIWDTDRELWIHKDELVMRGAILENIKRWYTLIYFVVGVGAGLGIRLRSGSDWNGNWHFDDQNFVDLPHVELILP